MLNNLFNTISPVIESAKISKIFSAIFVDSPVINFVIIHETLIISRTITGESIKKQQGKPY